MLPKEIFFVLAICLAKTSVYGEEIVEVKGNMEITNKKYPEFAKTSETLLLGNSQLGGAILANCQVKMEEGKKDCTAAYFKISDGIQTDVLCRNTGYRMHSKYNSIKIDLKILKKGFGISFNCNTTAMPYGRSDENEELIKASGTNYKPLKSPNYVMKVNDSIANTEIKGNLSANMNIQYKFIAEKGQNIYMICSMSPFVTVDPEDHCKYFRLKAEGGSRNRWQCKLDKYFTFISEENRLTISVTTGAKVSGYLSCDVKAIKKVIHSNYKEVESEEELDSSEFGFIDAPRTKELTCECGWANKEVKRVLFGEEAGLHEFPWAVSLQYKSSGSHFCGGSVITPYHVLTAAHCLTGTPPGNIMAVMGSHDRSDKTLASDVTAIYSHHYNPFSHIYDIAILELKSEVKFTQFLGPVCLPTVDPQLLHQHVTAMGWGRLHPSEVLTRDRKFMKKTTLRVIDIESCSLDWNFHFDVQDPKVICTWNKNSDICVGDSGGPVTWHDPEINRYTLVGLPALCDGCVLTLPSAHTAVHYFHKWIIDTIKNSSNPNAMPCSKID